MIHCTNCGTEFEGRFCPSCGTPAAGAANPAAPSAGPQGTVPPPLPPPEVPGLPSNMASIICYVVFVVGPLVFLFLAPYNRDPRIRFNAWQALFLHFAYLAAELILGVFTGSWQLTLLLTRIVHLGFLIVIVFMCVKCYQNEKFVLPGIGPLAEKQK